MAYELATTIQFWKSVEKLDGSSRKSVLATLAKVQDGQESVHVHKLKGVPFVSFGVNKNAIRVVCKREGEILLMCHVAAHDRAYDWARRHKVLQVGRFVRIVRSHVVDEAPDDHPSPDPQVAVGELTGPLASIVDKVFETFDIGPEAAAVMRAVPDVNSLLSLLEHFPLPRAEALLALATDPDDLSSIETAYLQGLEAVSRGEAIVPPSFDEAIRDDVNAGEISTDPEDNAFQKALEGDFAAWRVFLHPSQQRVVRINAKGAIKVTGGPGTGKTVVALHRARHLATKLDGPILLTTFNATLARQLSDSLDQLCGKGTKVRKHITVQSLTKAAQSILKKAGQPSVLITDDDACWQTALAHDTQDRGQRFYESEREHVVARTGAWTEAAYLTTKRTGRSSRLDRKARKQVWKVLDAYEGALAKRKGGDGVALAREATKALLEGKTKSPYQAVICDEVQDVGASELRFLAALGRDTKAGKLRPNGLTLCGDGHQRIYRVPVTLQACGIIVRGRASRKLRLNYRTTDAIRRHAVAIVKDLPLDELDQDSGSPLEGYRSLRAGVPPEHHEFATASEEADWIAERARELTHAPLLVLARTKKYLEQLEQALTERGLEPRVLGPSDRLSPEDELVLCTMHRAKGLEAPSVIIAGRQLVPAKYPGGGDKADRELWAKKERSLLYVAISRARDWVATSRGDEQ